MSMTELHKMNIADIEQCGDIHYRAFHNRMDEVLAKCLPDYSSKFIDCFDFKRYFSRFIEDYDKYAFCIICDNQLVGYITALEFPNFFDEKIVYIDSIAVAPEFQKKGYGKEALKQFKDLFPETTIKLQTTKDRPAYKMYQQLGFIDVELQIMETSPVLEKIHKETQLLKQK